MKTLDIKAPAKINLFLNIKGILTNGYHDMDMVMVNTDLYDDISLSFNESGKIFLENEPEPEKNLVYKAAQSFYRVSGILCPGLTIGLKKNIPAGTGLGGGSADAAAVLRALAEHHGYKGDLFDTALSLGADVPYCLLGSAASVGGIGEKLEPLPHRDIFMLIAVPDGRISTIKAFQTFDSQNSFAPVSSDGMKQAFLNGDLSDICAQVFNCMETSSATMVPEILDAKDRLLELGAMAASMSGSGSAVFGIFPDEESAAAAFSRFDLPGMQIFKVRTC